MSDWGRSEETEGEGNAANTDESIAELESDEVSSVDGSDLAHGSEQESPELSEESEPIGDWTEPVSSSRAVAILGGEDGISDSELLPQQEDVAESIIHDVKEYFEGEGLDDRIERPDTSFLEEQFFDFSYLEQYEELERTWVDRPYAYVTVLYDPSERKFRYFTVEPMLTEFEQYVRKDLVEYLRNSFLYKSIDDESDKEAMFEGEVIDQILAHARGVEPGSLWKILYYLRRDFLEFGPINPIMRDNEVEDVSCDGAGVPIYVYHGGYRDLETNVEFSAKRLSSFVVRLAQRAGKQISVSDPLADASLPDGSRVQLTLGGDVSTRGANFTIRKFSDVPLSPVDLIEFNTFSAEQMAYFWLAIENNKSLVFAGGTGSGKTTSMNAVSFFIPADSKVVTIEDTREIDLPHENWVQSVTRDSASEQGRGEVSMFELLKAALRQRPEYLLVGEIRTEQNVALTFFQAMGTGHTAYTTMHADSIDTVINRLQNEPLNVPAAMIQDLDIVSIQRQATLESGRVRRNQQVTEVLSPDGEDVGRIQTNDVFRYQTSTDTHEKLGGSIVMQEVAEQRGWTEAELELEIERRETVLRYLHDRDVHDYRDVAAVIYLYNKDPDFVIDRIREHGYDI